MISDMIHRKSLKTETNSRDVKAAARCHNINSSTAPEALSRPVDPSLDQRSENTDPVFLVSVEPQLMESK